MDKKTLHMVSYVLVIVGALNWGLVGLLNFNLVNALFSAWPVVEKLVYLLVGVAAVYELISHTKSCKYCSEKK